MGAVLISVVIIFLLSSVLFISSSLQDTLLKTVQKEADFTVQRVQAGKAVATPRSWIDKIMEIDGVTQVSSRVYGRYFFAPREHAFLIVGIDFFDEQSSQLLQSLLKDLDLKSFLSQESMIIGSGVKSFLEKHYYKEYFTFKTPQGTFKKVAIAQSFSKEENLLANDMILMPIDLAREIFGMNEEEVTDITFSVPNDAEWDNIVSKLHLLFYDVRVIEKREVKKHMKIFITIKEGSSLCFIL